MSDPASLRIARPNRLLRDQVTDTLRNAVLGGYFTPGERLTETKLLELTGVSRTSLREGLRQLQTEGLVEPADSRGLRVISLTEDELAELYEVREYLESAVVELFVLNASDAQIDELERIIVNAAAQVDTEFDPPSNYYNALFTGAGNTLFRQLHSTIDARIVMMQNLTLRVPGRAAESHLEIRAVIDRIRERDVAGARDAARAHVRSARKAAIAALRNKDLTTL